MAGHVGPLGGDDSATWIYEKDVLGPSPPDGAGASVASGSVESAKISLAARTRLWRREERLALSVLLLMLQPLDSCRCKILASFFDHLCSRYFGSTS
ncbi:hypothetical protein OG21DRAFT_1513271 [Imleria badia]|nr:hypothetical protein OG21DRAFT_1513271 [Imleria badia]